MAAIVRGQPGVKIHARRLHPRTPRSRQASTITFRLEPTMTSSMTRRLFSVALLGLLPAMATVASANGDQDPRLVGRWVQQAMINSSGGSGGFASFTTERSIEFGRDGQVQQWVRSVGGGSNWSTQSGRRLEFAGRWEVRGNEIWVQPQGRGDAVRAGTYQLSGPYLVTVGQDGRTIWQR
jgi:hypothetical protein